MSTSVRKGWIRGPYGYRETQLESADFTAAMTLFVAGVPALMVGAELAGLGIGFGQLILAAPIGALLGAFSAGLMARKAAANGTPSVYLARPAFGSIGAALLTLFRLIMTVAWGAIVLRVAGEWLSAAVTTIGLSLPGAMGPIIVAAIGVLMLAAGPAWMVGVLLRRRLFGLAVVAVLVAAWVVLNGTGVASEHTMEGGFLDTIDAVFGLALLWMAVGGDVAGFGQREEETASGIGFGFGVAALVFVLGGAAMAGRFGGFPADLTVLGAGVLAGVAAIVWVPLMESDGFSGLVTSGGFSLESLIPVVPPLVLAVIAGGASLVASIALPVDQLRDWTFLAATLFAPGVGVVLADAYVVRRGAYLTDDLYRWRGEYGLLNVAGMVSWVIGVGVALWLRPVGPPMVRDAIIGVAGEGSAGLPVLIIGLVTGAVPYFGLGWLVLRGRAATYRLRGF
ncbi:MAG: cytosine permease [Acidimicrobiia bacterium]|nr:cytosine permease [Acidimicrobiia bacterium]